MRVNSPRKFEKLYVYVFQFLHHAVTHYSLFVCFWRSNPQWVRTSSLMRFLDHTQRRTTAGRTPLDE